MEQFKPAYLLKEEVDYELNIRGVVSKRVVEDRRKILLRLLDKERDSPGKLINMTAYKFDFAKEKSQIDNTLTSVKNFVEGFEGLETDPIFLRLKSRLAHVVARIGRMPIDAEQPEDATQADAWRDMCDYKDESFASALVLEAELYEKVTKPSQASASAVQPAPIVAYPTPEKAYDQKISKWNIKFDGNPNKLYSFLEHVQEIAKSRKTSDTMLFASAVEFFIGDAFIWYRSVQADVKNWATLVDQLKRDFLPRDFDDELWEQIKARKQQKKEKVTIYIAHMETLFSRLTRPPIESTRVKFIKQNLLVEYYKQLALLDIDSVKQLKEFAKRLEDSNIYLLGSDKRTFDKDMLCFSYTATDGPREDRGPVGASSKCTRTFGGGAPRNPNFSRRPPSSNRDSQTAGPSKVTCWNCGLPNHTFNSCTAKRNKFCFRCGRPNVKTVDCTCRTKN